MLERECPDCLDNSLTIPFLGNLLGCKKCGARFSLAGYDEHTARIAGTTAVVTFLLTGIFFGIKAFAAVTIPGCFAAYIYEKIGPIRRVSSIDADHS